MARPAAESYTTKHSEDFGDESAQGDAVNAGETDFHQRDAVSDIAGILEGDPWRGAEAGTRLSEADCLNGAKMARGEALSDAGPEGEKRALESIALAFRETDTNREQDSKAVSEKLANRVMESQFPGVMEDLNERSQVNDFIPADLRAKAAEWNTRQGVKVNFRVDGDGSWTMQMDAKSDEAKKAVTAELREMGYSVRDIGKGREAGSRWADGDWEQIRPLNEEETERLAEMAEAAEHTMERMKLKEKALAESLAETKNGYGTEGTAETAREMQEILDDTRAIVIEEDLGRLPRNIVEDFSKMSEADGDKQEHCLKWKTGEAFSGTAEEISQAGLEWTERLDSAISEYGSGSPQAHMAENAREAADISSLRLMDARNGLFNTAKEALENGDEAGYSQALAEMERKPEEILTDFRTAMEEILQGNGNDRDGLMERIRESDDHAVMNARAQYDLKLDQLDQLGHSDPGLTEEAKAAHERMMAAAMEAQV